MEQSLAFSFTLMRSFPSSFDGEKMDLRGSKVQGAKWGNSLESQQWGKESVTQALFSSDGLSAGGRVDILLQR